MMAAIVARPKRVECGAAMAAVCSGILRISHSKEFNRILDKLIATWQMVEQLDDGREGLYELVREIGDDLYIFIISAVNRMNLPPKLHYEAKAAMADWLKLLSPEESINLLTRIELLHS